MIDNAFEDFNKKIWNLVDNLLNYNKVVDELINKYALIYNKNQNDIYDNNNIKILINEILSLERNHFNDKTFGQTKQFLNSSIKLIPSINLYHIKEIIFINNIFLKTYTIIYTGRHFKVGDFKIVLSIE